MCRKNKQKVTTTKSFFLYSYKKGIFTVTHQHNTIGSKTPLHCIMHLQAISPSQLFAGHLLGSWPRKG